MLYCAAIARTALAVMSTAAAVFLLTVVEAQAETAKKLIEEALHREIYGDRAQRDALLQQALRLEPENPAAMWHRGYVYVDSTWQPAGTPLEEQLPLLTDYAAMRKLAPDTLAGQVQLANWCRERGLRDQERAHLLRVVEFDSQHLEARRRLGYRPVNGDWILEEDIAAAEAQRREQAAALEQWRDRLVECGRLLDHPSGRRRNLARRQLQQLDEQSAIYPLEQVLARQNEASALAAVGVLSRFETQEGVSALIRLAVLSPWSSVRRAAVIELRKLKPDRYIPQLLAAMHGPLTARIVAVHSVRGGLVLQAALEREGRDERDQLVLDSPQTAAIARDDVARENYRAQRLNRRIAAALNLATDQNLPASPEVWWKWWNDANGVYVSGEKPVHAIRPGEQMARIDIQEQIEARIRAQQIAEMARRPRSQPAVCDCLAAGTPVWTATGAVPVEKILMGDMVLAQDAETGELAYKVVLQTTIRPPSRLFKIHAGDETIEASAGHPFWVSGEGWVKARDLRGGMELHTSTGPVRIALVEPGSLAPSYNLVVDELNTYFAGRHQILTHDNTVRRATGSLVPGLREE